MKGKVTQSLAGGLPVVTTAVGAEGLDSSDGDALLIAEDPAGLAERIVRLAGDDALWRRLAEEGRGVVERTCSPALLQSRLAALLED
jgi:glycosyltransferase involved in cell wall biosynthesis